MEKYLGVKLISAKQEVKLVPMEGTTSDSVENGYKVVYEDGYTSWSPKDVFEKAYRRIKDGIPLDKGNWEPYQERVVNEARELRENKDELFTFIENDKIFKSLNQPEQNRLNQQLLVMQYYLTILIERIENFK